MVRRITLLAMTISLTTARSPFRANLIVSYVAPADRSFHMLSNMQSTAIRRLLSRRVMFRYVAFRLDGISLLVRNRFSTQSPKKTALRLLRWY